MNDNTDPDKELKVDHVSDKLAPKHYKTMKLSILNAPVLTAVGTYATFPVPVESARILSNTMDVTSYIGHSSTAKTISRLLERPIKYTRDEFTQEVGQIALVFNLKKRPPEGAMLSKEELEEIGYEFWILYRTA